MNTLESSEGMKSRKIMHPNYKVVGINAYGGKSKFEDAIDWVF